MRPVSVAEPAVRRLADAPRLGLMLTIDIASINAYNARYMVPTTKHRSPRSIVRAERQIAEHIATWRKLRGLTQTQLAERADVARTTIQRLEGGGSGVSLENLLRVLRALGLLDNLPRALDPFESDVGRLRSDENLPRRVRPRQLGQREE
jgi:transcriptional regulator with XRE-family HTH domain